MNLYLIGAVLISIFLVWAGPAGMKEIAGKEEPIDLVLMPAPCSYRKIAFDSLTKVGRPWRLSMEANSVQAVQSAIRAGLGVSILPRSTIAEDLSILSGQTLPELPNTSVLSYVDKNVPNPYAERFIEFLIACIDDKIAESIIFPDKV